MQLIMIHIYICCYSATSSTAVIITVKVELRSSNRATSLIGRRSEVEALVSTGLSPRASLFMSSGKPDVKSELFNLTYRVKLHHVHKVTLRYIGNIGTFVTAVTEVMLCF